jgi:XTP/dITP diphosphohydrolase
VNNPAAIVIATHNMNKGQEIASIMRRYLSSATRIMTLADFPTQISLPDETGTTFCENAAIKAEYVAKATGIVALGDDSGLSVWSLNGAPGLHSRRWSGENDSDAARNDLLLKTIESKDGNDRSASFLCCVCLASPSGETSVADGECKGYILRERRGLLGFGYDPLFLVGDSGKTMAELTAEEKNEISHRALAIKSLAEKLGWSLLTPSSG